MQDFSHQSTVWVFLENLSWCEWLTSLLVDGFHGNSLLWDTVNRETVGFVDVIHVLDWPGILEDIRQMSLRCVSKILVLLWLWILPLSYAPWNLHSTWNTRRLEDDFPFGALYPPARCYVLLVFRRVPSFCSPTGDNKSHSSEVWKSTNDRAFEFHQTLCSGQGEAAKRRSRCCICVNTQPGDRVHRI